MEHLMPLQAHMAIVGCSLVTSPYKLHENRLIFRTVAWIPYGSVSDLTVDRRKLSNQED